MASNSNSNGNSEVLDPEKFDALLQDVKEFSSSLSERAIIKKLVKPIENHLPLEEEEIRKILLHSFKQYRKKHTVPIQKIALLERGKRDQNLLDLKNTIIESFISVIGSKKKMRSLVKSMEKALVSFFEPYLEF